MVASIKCTADSPQPLKVGRLSGIGCRDFGILERIVAVQVPYRLYRTDQHRTGTDNYRYSNRQRLRVYWLYWGDRWIYIQDREIVSAGRLTVHMAGMLV